MRRFLYLIFIILILGGGAWLFSGLFSAQEETITAPAKEVRISTESDELSGGADSAVYTNPDYKISLRYPASWQPDNRYGTIGSEGGLAVRFSGPDGFFGVDALGSAEESLEGVVNTVAYHRLSPYGENPTIIKAQAAGQEAAFVFPSDDQPQEARGEAVLLVRYPEPVRVELSPNNFETFAFFALYAPKDQIQKIAATLDFIE